MKDASITEETFETSFPVIVLYGEVFGKNVYQIVFADIGIDMNLMVEKLFKKLFVNILASKWTASQNLQQTDCCGTEKKYCAKSCVIEELL